MRSADQPHPTKKASSFTTGGVAMTLFTNADQVKCPKCGHEWYNFKSEDKCPDCRYYINTREFESCVIGRGTAEDVSSQRIKNP